MPKSEPIVLNIPKPQLGGEIPQVEDQQFQKYLIPLDGKWIPAQDPCQIGKNFQQLTNIRYKDKNVEGVLGMSKINASPIATHLKVRSAFHAFTNNGTESHLLMQGKNTDLSESCVIDFTTAPPNTGSVTDSALWTDSSDTAAGFFSAAPGGTIAYCNGDETCLWGGSECFSAAFIVSAAAVTTTTTNPKDYSDIINNSSQDADNSVSIGGSYVNILVGSLRPLKGVKFYISSGNASASTMTGSTWNGTSWATLTITDNTSSGGKSLAQTGTVTFSSTVGTSKLRYLDGYLLYWYQFILSAGSATVYRVTQDAPFQEITDIWDGYERYCGSFYLYKSGYQDYWVNVYNDDYITSDSSTYAELDGLVTGTQYILIGFTKKTAGINFSIAPSHFNTTAATTASVFYWNGTSWASAGNVFDGTSESSISMAKSGVIYWNASGFSGETKQVIKGGYPMYYYKISFNKTLSGDVQLYYVSGIPAPSNIHGYCFPVHAADRLILIGNQDEYPNRILISAEQAPQVMNGDNHFAIYIGDEKPLTGGCAMFAQFASNLYNLVMLYKKSETWMLTWVNSSEGTVWERYMISDTVGCPAPGTIQTSSVSFDGSINQTRNISIWQSHDGIYISDGRTPLCVSTDIETVFDQNETTHVNLVMIDKNMAFVDKRRNEYHWLWASGTSTTLDKEYVLDLKRWKWFEIDRTVDLQCGVNVTDSYGNNYNYGFIDTGYIEYLENGQTMDGTAITQTLWTGDQILIENDIFTQTRVEKFVLVALSRNSDTSATITNYLDAASSGTAHSVTVSDASHRLVQVVDDIYSEPAVFHSFKVQMTTDSENKGLVPMFLGAYYIPEREHLK